MMGDAYAFTEGQRVWHKRFSNWSGRFDQINRDGRAICTTDKKALALWNKIVTWDVADLDTKGA